MPEDLPDVVDVAIVGGGPAGLAAALVLARSRRSVLVLDAGEPRNATAAHAHNYLTRDGAAPAELRNIGADEVQGYGGRIVACRVTAIQRADDGFVVESDGGTVRARRLIAATGLRDELPDVAGVRERWGRDVLHCPYCHGWEVRDRRVTVLATGPMAIHQALLFRQLTDRVTVLTHSAPPLSDDQREQCAAVGVSIVDGAANALELEADRLVGVRVGDESIATDALVVAPRFVPNAELLTPLGVEVREMSVDGYVIAGRIDADPTGATSVAGLWVAGNVADPQAQLISSAAQGTAAGAAVNADLVAADTRAAVREARYGEQAWNERYSGHSHLWSGRPNPTLVDEVAQLSPGCALDAGAGEGGDAFWLAERGWRVAAVDLSSAALARAAEHAADRPNADRISWRQVDLVTDDIDGSYELVTAHFLHLPPDMRTTVFAKLAAAVAPGGTLLVVGHDLSDVDSGIPRHGLEEGGWAPTEVADALGDGWTIEITESRSRPATLPDGTERTVADAVTRARRDD